MKVTDRYVIFYGGIYSQWFACEFKDKEGTMFSSTEQFMMYHKARFFNDEVSMGKIMRESDPRKIKAMGREVSNFNEKEWNKVNKKIVTLGNFYKFSQDSKLKEDILLHKNKQFVEGSPYDKLWGIGLNVTDPRAEDADGWQGLNWLGECIDQARVMIDIEDNASIIELFEGIVYKKKV